MDWRFIGTRSVAGARRSGRKYLHVVDHPLASCGREQTSRHLCNRQWPKGSLPLGHSTLGGVQRGTRDGPMLRIRFGPSV